MKFKATNNHLEFNIDSCIVTGIFEDYHLFPSTDYINKISQGYVTSLLKRNLFTGSLGKQLILYDAPYFLNRQILLVGCGKKDDFNENCYRDLIPEVIKSCNRESVVKILFLLAEFNIQGYDNYWKIRDTVSLFNKECYLFNRFKTHNVNSFYCLNEVLIYIRDPHKLDLCKKAISDGIIIAKGVNLSKDLSNTPPNHCTPIYLSNQVQDLTKRYSNLTVEVLDESALTKLGMNAYLSVGKGSYYPAIMPIIKYKHDATRLQSKPIILIGKGLTFDSGGISIKPADRMDEMKYDMCGAAAVYAIMCIAAELDLPLNIIGILALSENMINDKSLRPGDILTTLSGQTVEVINTDAEGRLVLCDVLTYAQKYYDPSMIIDIATLTGACVVALGNYFSGLMSNDDRLAMDLLSASQQTMDHAWRLPIHKAFTKQLESTCADMMNVGGRYGGAITAACFLQKFVDNKYRWAHLDIAGTAWCSDHRKKSATGRPVELLSQFLINQSFSPNLD